MAVTRSPSTQEGMLRVVVVEDDDTYADMVRRLLISRFEIVRARSLTELLDVSRERDPNVILLDLRLPDGGDPLALVVKICAKFREAAVIITTGLDDETLALDTLRAGAQDYLVKEMFVQNQMVKKIMHAHARKAASVRAAEAQAATAVAASNSSMHIAAVDPDLLEKKLTKIVEKLLEEKVLARHHMRPRSDVFEPVPQARVIDFFGKITRGNWKFIVSTVGLILFYLTEFRDTVVNTAAAVEHNAIAVQQIGESTKAFEDKQKKKDDEFRKALIKMLVISVKSTDHLEGMIEAAAPKVQFDKRPAELDAAKKEVKAIEGAKEMFSDDPAAIEAARELFQDDEESSE